MHHQKMDGFRKRQMTVRGLVALGLLLLLDVGYGSPLVDDGVGQSVFEGASAGGLTPDTPDVTLETTGLLDSSRGRDGETRRGAPGHPEHDNTTYDPQDDTALPADRKQQRWAHAAFSYIRALDCHDVFLTTERECRRLLRTPQREMAVHVAGPSPYGRLRAVLPSGGLSQVGSHHAVVAIDPYPAANFGHLVLVFYVELGTTASWCQVEGGTFLEGGECLILALNQRCKNALERRKGRRNFARRCEINFLPFVYLEPLDSDPDSEDDTDGLLDDSRQLLICRSNVSGFGSCPPLRSPNATSGLFCNPIRENTKHCETTHETIQTSCRVFEICDQAVIISGGWNRWSHRPYHQQNVWDFYHMLRQHGFRKQGIKVFFANGNPGIAEDGEATHEVHPAALKLAMRYHIQEMCQSPHCVDSLVLYLNSPARSDGTSLLWDADRDGMVSESEMYTLPELMTDIADCQARQVHVVVDQSYSGEVVRAFRRSKKHTNVMVLASSRDNQYSYGRHFTQFWTQNNHTRKCVKEVFREARKALRLSTPVYNNGEEASNVNIFGAPCDVIPPFTHRELRENYLGCQNLPTAMWVMKFIHSPDRKSPRLMGLDTRDDFYDDVDDDAIEENSRYRGTRSALVRKTEASTR